MNIIHKKIKGYSILEVLITLVIYGVLTLILVNTLIINLKISRSISNRTRVRTELTELASLIERDIRNASNIYECSNTYSVAPLNIYGPNLKACNLSIPSNSGGTDSAYTWVYSEGANICGGSAPADHYFCKRDGSNATIYKTSNIIRIDQVTFEKILSSDQKKATIIITIVASSRNTDWNITNQVRQIIVSTRNYKVNLTN